MELYVVHLEVTLIVRPPHPREVVIRGPARREDDIHELPLDEGPQDAADARRHEGGREREECRARPSAEHRPKDVDAHRDFLRGEATATAHRLDESCDLGGRSDLDVLHPAPQEGTMNHLARNSGHLIKDYGGRLSG